MRQGKREAGSFPDVFDRIPFDLFKPLAAENRRFYAGLLVSLEDRAFSAIGVFPRKATVLDEIEEFTKSYEASRGALSEDPDQIAGLSVAEKREIAGDLPGRDPRRHRYYHYLVRCGWLVEIRDKFRRMVDLSPEGRLILSEVRRISQGDVRSYGGTVLSVLSSIESAIDSPDDRSEALVNAHEHAINFSQHLRTLATMMRQTEEHVCSQKGAGNLFRAFFEDFIAEFVIRDFKTLYTRNNPFRFRSKILERVTDLRHDDLRLKRLSVGYVREGRAVTEQEAARAIQDDLEDIYRVFDGIDSQLSVIDETQARIQSRIQTTIRYMDRESGSVIDRATKALAALAATKTADDSNVDIQSFIVSIPPPVGPDSLYAERRPRQEIGRMRLRDSRPDPALVLFQQAKATFARRIMVSPTRMRAYARQILGTQSSIKGSEIDVSTIDDFISFQRLRELPTMFNGVLGRDFEIEPLPDRVENQWMEFEDFILRPSRQPRR
jgi:hypothetical protein